MISQQQFNDLQEFFLIVFGPYLQWLFVGIVAGVVAMIVLIMALTMLRRMFKSA